MNTRYLFKFSKKFKQFRHVPEKISVNIKDLIKKNNGNSQARKIVLMLVFLNFSAETYFLN